SARRPVPLVGGPAKPDLGVPLSGVGPGVAGSRRRPGQRRRRDQRRQWTAHEGPRGERAPWGTGLGAVSPDGRGARSPPVHAPARAPARARTAMAPPRGSGCYDGSRISARASWRYRSGAAPARRSRGSGPRAAGYARGRERPLSKRLARLRLRTRPGTGAVPGGRGPRAGRRGRRAPGRRGRAKEVIGRSRAEERPARPSPTCPGPYAPGRLSGIRPVARSPRLRDAPQGPTGAGGGGPYSAETTQGSTRVSAGRAAVGHSGVPVRTDGLRGP